MSEKLAALPGGLFMSSVGNRYSRPDDDGHIARPRAGGNGTPGRGRGGLSKPPVEPLVQKREFDENAEASPNDGAQPRPLPIAERPSP
jgi:hypothetical protein